MAEIIRSQELISLIENHLPNKIEIISKEKSNSKVKLINQGIRVKINYGGFIVGFNSE